MSKLRTLFIGVAALTTAGLAHAAPGGTGSYVDFAARNLTSSAQNLVYILQTNQAPAYVTADAQTLVDAAEHFQEEVELGPEDLDQDYVLIEQTFTTLQGRFAGYVQQLPYLPQLASAWSQVAGANTQLTQAWSQAGGGGINPPPPPPPPPPRTPVSMDIGCGSHNYQHCSLDQKPWGDGCGNFRYLNPPLGQLLNVTIKQQTSHSECIQGQSWGVDATRVWCDQGCSGIFTVTYYPR